MYLTNTIYGVIGRRINQKGLSSYTGLWCIKFGLETAIMRNSVCIDFSLKRILICSLEKSRFKKS